MQFSGNVLSPAEAEIEVRQLKPLPVDRIGSEEWKTQRFAVEQLNMCAHSNAVLKKDDYVKSFLIEHEQLPTLLYNVLAMEAWRHRVLPNVLNEVATNPSALYMYGQYESVLLNLLECVLYFEEVVVALGDDILELIDYCWRQVAALFSDKHINDIPSNAHPGVDALKEDPVEALKRQLRENAISRAMTCLSCLWFVVDRIAELPMSAKNSILSKNDLPMGLAEVMMLQPWTRRGDGGVVQKYIQNTFVEVKGDEVMRVCIPEAHTWFSLHKLLSDPDCRTTYTYTKHRKDIIVRIKRFLTDILVDQLPVLVDVQRALEELSFLEPPTGTEEKFKTSLVIEQVPRLLSAIENKNINWTSLTERFAGMLKDPRLRMEDAHRMSAMFDALFTEAQKEKQQGQTGVLA